MEHETYGKEAAWVVVDEEGKLAVDGVYNGFDQEVLQQIRNYRNPSQPDTETMQREKPMLADWQKYMENGEYLRSSELDGEQNYNMIDGMRNNKTHRNKKGRVSVLAKLRQKQAEIAARSGKPVQQAAVTEDIERRRK